MGSSQVPALTSSGTSDNYVLISSVSPVAAASTVSFTSISGYRKLMFKATATTLATGGTLNLTFNGDTGTNYAYAKVNGTSTMDNAQTQVATSIALGTSNNTVNPGLLLEIDGITSTGPKTFTGFGNTGGVTTASINGAYIATAALTTVTWTTTTTFSGAGTVALYGVVA
jgi:hypothetical protein